jgi:hypothetical protein
MAKFAAACMGLIQSQVINHNFVHRELTSFMVEMDTQTVTVVR